VTTLTEHYQQQHDYHCQLITVVANVVQEMGPPAGHTAFGYAAVLLSRVTWLPLAIERAAVLGDAGQLAVLVRRARDAERLLPCAELPHGQRSA